MRIVWIPAIVLVAAVGVRWIIFANSVYHGRVYAVQLGATVPERDWYDGIQRHLVFEAQPAVFRNSPARQWKAIRDWNPHYIQQRLGAKKALTGVYQGIKPTFLYFNINQPGKPKDWEKPFKTISMSVKEFFAKVQNASDPSYYYFSTQMLKRPSLADDATIHEVYEDVTPHDFLPESLRNGSTTTVNVWFGGQTVTAQAHYDVFHNFFVQVYGRKKFTLFAPHQWSHLYLHPREHPSHRQSSANLTHPGDVFPRVADAVAHEVVLYPGDMLYLPPYWFHHVEALDLSMSVNIWYTAEEQRTMDKIWEFPTSLQDYSGQIAVVQWFIADLLPRLRLGLPVANFSALLLAQKYYTSLPLGRTTLCEELAEVPASTKQRLLPDIIAIAELFNTIGASDVRHMVTNDYVEKLATWVAKSRNVEFLQGCFTQYIQ